MECKKYGIQLFLSGLTSKNPTLRGNVMQVSCPKRTEKCSYWQLRWSHCYSVFEASPPVHEHHRPNQIKQLEGVKLEVEGSRSWWQSS